VIGIITSLHRPNMAFIKSLTSLSIGKFKIIFSESSYIFLSLSKYNVSIKYYDKQDCKPIQNEKLNF